MPVMQVRLALGALLASAILVPSAHAQPSPAPAGPPTTRLPGYLTADQVADSIKVVGPPPAAGSGALAGDVQTYEATRRLDGTPRWALALRDHQVGPPQMMADFSCAMGMALTPQSAPLTFRLFSRLLADSAQAFTPAKDFYKRPRPFVEKGGKVCLADPDRDLMAKTWSYPSAHSTYGWLAGLVMAQIAPGRATALLARARSYGESRVVCGVHYESDIQAGRLAASGVFAAEQTSAGFIADVQAARTELAQLQTHPVAPDPAECAVEAEASNNPVW